ncbi:MAG TPA: hypothetical protein VES95_11805 [Dermatophilaceae bacterium]|nr:hypothetical protein [Dermatophilaceae bacterium]
MTEVLVVVAVMASMLALGLVANRWVRPFAKNESQGVKLELLVSPLLTLTVLLLTFVLVQVFAGFKSSKDAAALEAGRTVYMYDLADYYEDDIALPMQQALVCYNRAVAGVEWESLADDPPALSPVVARWGGMLDPPLKRLRTEADGQPYGALLGADKERLDGLRLRLSQARPAVPLQISLLLLGVSGVAIAGIAAFTLPYVSRRTQIGALVTLTVVLGLVQVTILDLDRKYDGVIQVQPEDFRIAGQFLVTRYDERFPEVPLPCDASGRPAS